MFRSILSSLIILYILRILKIQEPGIPTRVSIAAIIIFLVSLGSDVVTDFSKEHL
jgi:hypothetical protein